MTWTNVSKPSSTTYTNVNARGREQYDQATIGYDDSSIFFDAFDNHIWSRVSKPARSSNIQAGMATGLLMSITYATDISADTSWTKVTKPS